MKKHIFIFISFIAIAYVFSISNYSCKKPKSNSSSADSATFYFHLHTQIIDSTIGGNLDGFDSNTTGSNNVWYADALGRPIQLFVPQFFISNIMLVNATGGMYLLKNVVILKGLDSEDYYLAKVPVGTYVSAMFQVGLANADSAVNPPSSFINDGVPFPTAATMWTGTNYVGMKITGAYDTSSGHTGINPLPFDLEIPNVQTIQQTVSLPTRGSAAANNYPVYIATAGSINYIHLYCDYGKLLGYINLKSSNRTSVNPSIADTLANNLPNMFRYEQ